MTPEQMEASYRRMLVNGETVVFRRYSGTPRTATNCSVLARVIDEKQDQLAGAGQQAAALVIALYSDLVAASWPVPPRKNDKVVVRGKEFNIENVDDSTRRVAGTLIAYEVSVVG